jgi:hypothetical protein
MVSRYGYTRDQKEFLEDIDALIYQTERDIAAYQIGLDNTPEARKARRKRVLSGDFQFFAYTYFPHHIRGEPSTFQAAFCQRIPLLLTLESGVKEWWRAPRGECKSSLGTKILPLFLIVHALARKPELQSELNLEAPPRVFDYQVILGAETNLPAKLIEVTKTELVANTSLKNDFPEVCGRGDVWKIGEIVTLNGVRMEGYGADQAIRGQFNNSERPKWAIGDDLVSEKDAKSPTIRQKRWDWIEQAVEYLGPPDGSMHFMGLGTSINKDDPITRATREPGHLVHTFKAIETEPTNQDLWARCGELIQNVDKSVEEEFADRGEVATVEDLPSYQFYKKHQKKMDAGAKVSWPSVRSLYTLMRRRFRNNRAFEAEMQQNARSDEDQVFTSIDFWVRQMDHWIAYGGCDPSLGRGQTSDPSGILTGYWDPVRDRFNVAYAVGKRRVHSKLLSDLINVQQQFNLQCTGFENNNAYEIFRLKLMADALRRKVVMPLKGLTNNLGYETLIDSLEPFVTDGHITISNECKQLQTMMEDWPEKTSSHHYDLLMALWCAFKVAVLRAGGIPQVHSAQIDDNDWSDIE